MFVNGTYNLFLSRFERLSEEVILIGICVNEKHGPQYKLISPITMTYRTIIIIIPIQHYLYAERAGGSLLL